MRVAWRPRRIGWIAAVLVVVVSVGAMALLRNGSDSRSGPVARSSGSDLFQIREVRQVIPSDSPAWDETLVSCVAATPTSALGCLAPSEARAQEVVFSDERGTTKYRLGPALIGGSDVERATAVPAPIPGSSAWVVDFSLTPEATKAFAQITSRLVGRQLAIVVDDIVVSAPTVQAPITNGQGVIAGSLTKSQAVDLAARLDGAG